MTFRLREILLSRNITFSTFATRINMAPSSLAVNDKSMPTLANVQIYADELGMPAWELVYDCGITSSTPYIRPTSNLSLDDIVVQRVTTLLQNKNMSMRRLAMNMEVTAAALTQAFKRKKMGLKIVEKMATGLGVEPWELLATPEEVRAEVQRRKHELSIEDEPEEKADQESGAIERNDVGKASLSDAVELTDGVYRYGDLMIRLTEGRVIVEHCNPESGEEAVTDEDTDALYEEELVLTGD